MVNRTLLLLLPLACACVSAFTGDALVNSRSNSLRCEWAVPVVLDFARRKNRDHLKVRVFSKIPRWSLLSLLAYDCGTIAESP
jgi:hypothetical protein